MWHDPPPPLRQVHESLLFSARMRLPSNVTQQEASDFVDEASSGFVYRWPEMPTEKTGNMFSHNLGGVGGGTSRLLAWWALYVSMQSDGFVCGGEGSRNLFHERTPLLCR